MAFTDFKLISDVQERFSIRYQTALFIPHRAVEPSQTLIAELAFIEKYIDTRVSEFAIREGLIFPVLKEAYRKYAEKLALWSHRSIKYDDLLVGTPDYFISKRSELGKTVLGKPLLLMAEAKKNDFDEGWAQCLAEMVAAQKLNDNGLSIYGIVTDGQVWQFGKLAQDVYTYHEKMFTLGVVIHAYEEQHFPIEPASGIGVLAYLMEEHDLTQSELPEIGSQGVVSEILNGKRELNVRQIRALSERFGVSPAVFF